MANVTGNNFAGGLMGGIGDGVISNCSSVGSVTGANSIGGLVGYNFLSIITNSHSTGSVTGSRRVGGLAGTNHYDAVITNSHSTGSVTGSRRVGGLVGDNSYATIASSYAMGSVIDSGDSIGGLVGYNYSSIITNSHSTGSVTGSRRVGGLVGYNDYGSITNSYSVGSVTGDSIVGGLVASHSGGITNSYSVGSVTGDSIVGGLIGENSHGYHVTDDCFWNTETSGLSISAGGTPKTTAEMKTKSTFTNANWDFETIWAIDGITNDGYPFLDERVVAVTENILPTTNLTCSPNPCNTSSKIAYSVNNAAFVNIAVYDMLGNEVAVLVNNYQAAGVYEVIFNAESLSAGVYFITINTAGTMETEKIIVAR
jgi:hypothetical protein